MKRYAVLSFFLLSLLRAQTPGGLGPIDDSVRVTLANEIAPQLQTAQDQGPLAAGASIDSIMLLLKPTAAQQQALSSLLADQQDRASANYHHWLTPAQFADSFALSSADYTTITLGW